MTGKIIDVPKNDFNITTVEAEFDRAMIYKPPCFGQMTEDHNCSRCNWPPECKKATEINAELERRAFPFE